MNKTLHTKFGTARINTKGYYQITSRKEGNHGKFLHRLIFEDYHNCKLDKNDVIHHIDGDKLNNHPATNLICMSKKSHDLLHYSSGKNHPCYGKHLSDEHKRKISETLKGKYCGENNWNYGNPNNHRHSEETKKKISESHKGKTHSEETIWKMNISRNNSCYYHVSKVKCKKCVQGFTWVYQYMENGKQKGISSVSLEKLEEKVKAKGLKWRKL